MFMVPPLTMILFLHSIKDIQLNHKICLIPFNIKSIYAVISTHKTSGTQVCVMFMVGKKGKEVGGKIR